MQDSFNENREKNYRRSRRISIATIIILLICLILAYFIWAMSDASIDGNMFQFGKIDVVVGYYDGDDPVVYGDGSKMFNDSVLVTGEVEHPDLLNHPHMVRKAPLKRKFYVENKGNVPAYYRIYFDNIDTASELGADKVGMASQILVTIREENSSDAAITRWASLMDRESINNMLDPKHGIMGLLGPAGSDDAKKNLIIELALPEEESDYTINNNCCLTFDLCVEAVQVKNNELDSDGGNFN